jgi:hypothetical protein
MIDIQWHPNRKDLRVFAGLLLGFSVIISAILSARAPNSSWPTTLLVIGVLAGVIGCLWPERIRLVYFTWMAATFPIGWIVSHLILAAIYFLIFAPLGGLLRLFGHDPMRRKLDKSTESYWQHRAPVRAPSEYFRQF